MTRMIDRLLARRADGYNELMYTGAYPVVATEPGGRSKEGPSAGLVRQAREAYKRDGPVAACMLARMWLFSEARFKFQSAVDDHLFGNTDLKLLERPWPNGTTGDLLARMEQDASHAGQAFIRLATPEDDSGEQLVRMRPDAVTIISEEVRDTAGRVFKRTSGYAENLLEDREPQFYATDEVAHYAPIPDPDAQVKGMSWVTTVLAEAGADIMLTSYKTEHLRNGALPGLLLRYSQKLSDPAIERLKKRFQVKFGGAANAGRVFVLDQGADATVAGSTFEQLQLDAISAAGERRICAVGGVPLEIVGLKEGDYQAAIRRMADIWARPHWRMACASLEHLVQTSSDIGPVRLWFDVSGIAALREGELARGQTTLVKAQAAAAFVTAGYSRKSAALVAESGDLTQLEEDPAAPKPGSPTGTRPPQAGMPEDLPGVVAKNLPNARPWQPPPVPGLPDGARGPNGSVAQIGRDARPFRGELEAGPAGRGLAADTMAEPATLTGAVAGRADWDPAKHPRVPGGSHGGEFAHLAGQPLASAAAMEGQASKSQARALLNDALPRGMSADSKAIVSKARVAERLAAAMRTPTRELAAACDENKALPFFGKAVDRAGDPSMIFAIHGRTGTLNMVSAEPQTPEMEAKWPGFHEPGAIIENLVRSGYRDIHRGGDPEVDRVIREAAAHALVRRWAKTSNDSDAKALAIQEAARREFGLSGVEELPSRPATIYEMLTDLDANEAVYRDFVRAEYNLTQADLKAAGVTSVRVYRGFSWDSVYDVPQWAQKAGKAEMPPLRPLSSWSIEERAAEEFANQGYGDGYGALLAATIPADRVVATPQTGTGCLAEGEVVAMAMPGTAWVRLRGRRAR